jgi:nucleoside-diphosphate-sugar epimerase
LWSKLWRTFYKAEQQLWPARSAESSIKNVLVIGGAGFIGSALLGKLLDKGYKVRVLDLFLYGYETIEAIKNHPNLEIVEADYQSLSSIVLAMQGMDAVVHLGAIVGDPACELDRGMTIELNSLSVRLIAEVAKIMNVERFIFASTCSVYGASDEVLDEYSLLKPISLYAESKVLTEQILMSMVSRTFSPVILRFGTIYGFSGRTRFDLVINLLTAKAVIDGEITVYGGDQWRPFIHVEDAALAISQVLEAPLHLVHNQIFNVGSNAQNYTIQQVAEIVHRLVPAAEIKNMETKTDQRNYRVNFNKIRNAVGFSPQWTVDEGVRQVIDVLRTGKIQDYRDPKYSNERFMRNEGLIRLKANSNGWLYDLLNATISPTPWDGVERRRTVRKQNDAEAIEIPEGDYSAAREKTVKIRYRRLETSKPPNP